MCLATPLQLQMQLSKRRARLTCSRILIVSVMFCVSLISSVAEGATEKHQHQHQQHQWQEPRKRPQRGTRVTRGPDWIWGEQDGGGKDSRGTVWNVTTWRNEALRGVTVVWDVADKWNVYRWGAENRTKWDLTIEQDGFREGFMWNEPITNDPRCSIDERHALLSLYDASGGPNWRNNAGWNEAAQGQQSNDPCVDKWDGVQCRDGQVITLRLDNNGLRGTLPSSLGALSQLAVLDLSLNKLSGTLPSQLGHLRELQHLELKLNQFVGSLPVDLQACSMLEWVSVARNKLTGSLPKQWAALGRLRRLFASHNELTGDIVPRELANSKLWEAGHPQVNNQARTVPRH